MRTRRQLHCFQRYAFLDLPGILEPVTMSIPAIAAAVSSSSSVMSFSDPSWLKSLLGSTKAILASSCRTRSIEMSSLLVRSSARSARSALTLTFLNNLEAAAAAVFNAGRLTAKQFSCVNICSISMERGQRLWRVRHTWRNQRVGGSGVFTGIVRLLSVFSVQGQPKRGDSKPLFPLVLLLFVGWLCTACSAESRA
jgi:hypothetical protein